MIKEALAVALGGALGCLTRHWVNRHFALRHPEALFPWHTLTVNVLGCLLVGLVIQAAQAQRIAPETRLFLVTGLFGGLTTFSTFSHDTWQCWQVYGVRLAILNLTANVVLGLIAVVMGVLVGRSLFASAV